MPLVKKAHGPLCYIVRKDSFRGIENGVDWGTPELRNVVAFDEEKGKELCLFMPSRYQMLAGEALRAPSAPMVFVDDEHSLSKKLAAMYQIPAKFMEPLAKELRETKGDVFPMSSPLTDDELVAEMETRGYLTIIAQDWKAHWEEVARLKAELVELRTRHAVGMTEETVVKSKKSR
jgi:hypothetical protein